MYLLFSDWMLLVAFVLTMITLFALIAKRRDSPANLYLLAAFVSFTNLEIPVSKISYLDKAQKCIATMIIQHCCGVCAGNNHVYMSLHELHISKVFPRESQIKSL